MARSNSANEPSICILPDLPLTGLEHFARRMMARKPAALLRIKDPHRTIEVACFLRLTLLRLMDGSLTLLDHQIAALWRGARERVEEARAGRLRRFRQLLGDLAGLSDDETLDATELRSRLRRLIAPFEPERQATQVAAIRQIRRKLLIHRVFQIGTFGTEVTTRPE